MRYHRVEQEESNSIVCEKDDIFYDLTAAESAIDSFRTLAKVAAVENESIEAVVERRLDDAPEIPRARVLENQLRPLDPDEVWGAGVTYAISQESRQDAGAIGKMYYDAYEADRPEVYFKATPSRTVGPDDAIGIRGDSDWNVPEPELTMVLYDGEIVGFTIGNDVCSRSIERENLLYLPQSKVYKRCCAVGPCIAPVDDPHDLTIELSIERDGTTVFAEDTSTSEMVRSVEELRSYFTRHNEVPELALLLTGTSIIPPDDTTLQPEDTVEIQIEEIGSLLNHVITV